jgi:molybdopterin/thiamine biosynthesis adenylyltransferase/rhodanese-related sulfurtransferase
MEISPADAYEMLKHSVQFFDVREESEIEQEIIPGAYAFGRSFLEIRIAEKISSLDQPIVLYCASGIRSLVAAVSIRSLGFLNVMSVAGGISAWKSVGLPTIPPIMLDRDERKRYARQLILSEVGITGQLRLKQAGILVIGAGGLGSPCLRYLAAAGIGHIGIIDHDVIDISNLQRQVLFTTDDVGKSKAKVAKDVLLRMNPTLRIEAFCEKFGPDNAQRICSSFNILIDCTDNFAARYLINDTALELNLPFIHGAVFQFEGHVALLNTNGNACYRCIYPEAPPNEISPSCSEAGVMGVVPGVIGTLQASKAIKWILGLNTGTESTVVYNGLSDSFSCLKLHKRLGCHCEPVN